MWQLDGKSSHGYGRKWEADFIMQGGGEAIDCNEPVNAMRKESYCNIWQNVFNR